MPDPVDISIIIRVRDERDALVRTLDELAKQEFDGTTEIIVIDNQSTDGSQEAALERGARVFNLPRQMFTYGRAINLGIARSCGASIVLLSAHAWPAVPNWLTEMQACLLASDKTMGVFCKQIPIEEPGYREAQRFAPFARPTFTLTKELIQTRLAERQSLYDASYFSNSAVILRRTATEAHPMRDLPYAEENAYALDCILNGMQVVYRAETAAFYRGGVSAKGMYHTARRQMIAEKLIEHTYGRQFDPDYRFGMVSLKALAQVIAYPAHLLRLVAQILFDPRYRPGSRARRFDMCALAGIWGRLVGAYTWRKDRHTMEVDHPKLAQADQAMTEVT